MTRFAGFLCLLLIALPRVADAQNAREAYLTLEVEKTSLRGEWKVRLLDLEAALQLDANHDGEVTWPEIEHRRADIEGYLHSHLRILTNGTDPGLGFDKLIYGTQNGEPFILAQLVVSAPEEISRIGVDYSLFFGRTADYRCLLKIVWLEEGMHKAVISAHSGVVSFTRESAAGSGFLQSLQEGIWHIWTGYDHILFLIVLLIPAVFQRTASGREAVPDFGSALLRVIVIVSAFTIAHSITLTCAAMQWVRLPTRLVESAIAASIFVAALYNFLPTTAGGRGAWLAFGFGLLHGFGFAGALSQLGAEGGPLWHTLLAFNLGVEVGQLAIVAVFLPVAYLIRETRFYRAGVVYGGSSMAGLCALFWFWQRAFGGPV
jgi:HupE / UreJ protein